MSEWQPIETAPKDGTTVLLCTQHWACTAWMVEENDGSRKWAVADAVSPDGLRAIVFLSGTATHWMPIPEPPVTP